jgi:hypothetical protein
MISHSASQYDSESGGLTEYPELNYIAPDILKVCRGIYRQIKG